MGKGQIAQGSIYPFPTVFGNLSAIFIEFEIVVCNIFSLEESKIFCLRKSKELSHYTGEKNYNRVAKRNKGAYDNLKRVLKWEKE